MSSNESWQTGEQCTGHGSVPRPSALDTTTKNCRAVSEHDWAKIEFPELHLAGDFELKANCPASNKWIQFCRAMGNLR